MRQRVLSARAIQSGPFASLWATFVLKVFHLLHFHTGRPIFIIQEGQYWEKGIHPTSKLDETEGFQCQGRACWTIFITLSHFCYENFPTFSLSYWEANSYYPRGPIMGKGNSPNFKIGWDRGFWVPGTFKLDHLHPLSPFCSGNFSSFSPSYWEANSY